MKRDLGSDAVFPLRLEKTYYNQGFFNIKRDFDYQVRGDEGPVTLQLRGGGRIKGYVNRRAQKNGTARVMGYIALRESFQQNYAVGDIVPITFSSPARLAIGYEDKHK